jgi:hypothetical protein
MFLKTREYYVNLDSIEAISHVGGIIRIVAKSGHVYFRDCPEESGDKTIQAIMAKLSGVEDAKDNS